MRGRHAGARLAISLRLTAISCVAVCCAGSAAVILAPRRAIITRTEIAAPPASVWAALTDASKYPQWHPDTRLLGRLAPGQTIEVQEGQGPDTAVFHPVLVVARPGQELRWLGHVWLPRVFDATHYFRLKADGSGTELIQGEEVRGVALWLFDLRRLVPGFDAMNAQVKRRAEAAG